MFSQRAYVTPAGYNLPRKMQEVAGRAGRDAECCGMAY